MRACVCVCVCVRACPALQEIAGFLSKSSNTPFPTIHQAPFSQSEVLCRSSRGDKTAFFWNLYVKSGF